MRYLQQQKNPLEIKASSFSATNYLKLPWQYYTLNISARLNILIMTWDLCVLFISCVYIQMLSSEYYFLSLSW
jgi:hypothetical protein